MARYQQSEGFGEGERRRAADGSRPEMINQAAALAIDPMGNRLVVM
jgi:hypothetical protein